MLRPFESEKNELSFILKCCEQNVYTNHVFNMYTLFGMKLPAMVDNQPTNQQWQGYLCMDEHFCFRSEYLFF